MRLDDAPRRMKGSNAKSPARRAGGRTPCMRAGTGSGAALMYQLGSNLQFCSRLVPVHTHANQLNMTYFSIEI